MILMIRRKSYLILSVLIFISVLGCGKNGKFQLSATDAVQAMLFSEEVVVPAEIMETVQAAGDAAVLVDVRPPSEFVLGHLLNAINVPSQHVLEPEYRKLWKKEGITYYFYGADQLEANGPWMVLRQMGYTNIRILQGGLGYFADFSDSSFLKLEDETARYNYAEVFSKAVEEANKINAAAPKPEAAPAKPKEVVPQKRPKLQQPAVQEAEEEEGC